MDAQKLTEELKRPLSPEKTLPEQNSSEKTDGQQNHTQPKSENPLFHLVGHGANWSLKNRTSLNKKH